MRYGFDEMRAFSAGAQEDSDLETIQKLVPGCASVAKANLQLDKRGVDYIATLRKGAEIFIDAKTRDKGCSRYWKASEPEVALEVWSVCAGGKFNTPPEQQKIGWTLDEAKVTDLILFKYDRSDHETVYLVSFQLLRIAFRQNLKDWSLRYDRKFQQSSRNGRLWESEAIFVPVVIMFDAINRASYGTRQDPNQMQLQVT